MPAATDPARTAALLLPDCTPAAAVAAALEDEENAADALFRAAGEFAGIAKRLQRAGELARKSSARVRVEGGEVTVTGDDVLVGKLMAERLAAEVKE